MYFSTNNFYAGNYFTLWCHVHYKLKINEVLNWHIKKIVFCCYLHSVQGFANGPFLGTSFLKQNKIQNSQDQVSHRKKLTLFKLTLWNAKHWLSVHLKFFETLFTGIFFFSLVGIWLDFDFEQNFGSEVTGTMSLNSLIGTSDLSRDANHYGIY